MNAPPQPLIAAGRELEYRLFPGAAARPTLLLLHEGLGSLALWKDFPEKLAKATGCRLLAYSRYGYGGSERLKEKRPVDYMHREALESLPEVRAHFGLERPLLVGHSDGASIALIHAGAGRWPVAGLVLMAPHVFVEDLTVASIAAAKEVYRTSDLGRRLARYHADPDGAFWGWNDIWLAPSFRDWNIERYLPQISCPSLVIQGLDDEYGSPAQVEAIARGSGGPVEQLLLPACKHSPHRDQEAATLEAIVEFVGRVA